MAGFAAEFDVSFVNNDKLGRELAFQHPQQFRKRFRLAASGAFGLARNDASVGLIVIVRVIANSSFNGHLAEAFRP